MHINYILINGYKGIKRIDLTLPICTETGENARNLFLVGKSGIGKTSFLEVAAISLLGGNKYYCKNAYLGKQKIDCDISVRGGNLKELSNVLAYSFNRNLSNTIPNNCNIAHLFEGGKIPMYDIYHSLAEMSKCITANENELIKERFPPFKNCKQLKPFYESLRFVISVCIQGDLFRKISNIQYDWKTSILEGMYSKGEYDCLALVSDIVFRLATFSKKGKLFFNESYQNQKAVVFIDNADSFMSSNLFCEMINGLNTVFNNVQFVFAINSSSNLNIENHRSDLFLSIDKDNPFLCFGSYYSILK